MYVRGPQTYYFTHGKIIKKFAGTNNKKKTCPIYSHNKVMIGPYKYCELTWYMVTWRRLNLFIVLLTTTSNCILLLRVFGL